MSWWRMARFLFFLAIPSICFFVPSVAAQQGMEPLLEDLGSIRGVVRDATTGREISDARVEISGLTGGALASDSTGSTGQFVLDSVPSGSYTIIVQHADYLALTQQLNTDGHPMFGLQLALRKKPVAASAATEASAPPAASGSAARATGIPPAAQDAMNRGMELLYVKSDARGSIDQFELAIRAYSGFYEAYTQIGMVRASLGDDAGAEKAFLEAIEISDQKFADAYAGLALVLSNRKRYSEAETAARKVIELDANDWRGYGELARALHSLRRFQDAEAPADMAAKLAPDNPTLQLMRSSIHLELRNLPAMLEDLDAYLKLVPTGAEADRMRELRGKVQQAIAAARPAQAP